MNAFGKNGWPIQFCLALGCALLITASPRFLAWGGNQKETKGTAPRAAGDSSVREKDRAAIRKAVQGLVDAFAKGDAEKAAAALTEGAELVPFEGPSLIGREAIQKAYAEHFAKHPHVKIEPTTESLRFLSRDAAVEEGTMHVTRGADAERTHHYSLLHVREDGKWLIAEIQESPTGVDNLSELSWLIGDWRAKQEDTELHINYDWFGEKAFLRGMFTIRLKDRTLTGMQLIGADPETGELRIWAFEHDGGVAAGTCTRDGESWLFETTGALTGGEPWSARNILLRVNQDTITWQPVLRTIGDEQVEDAPPVKVVRAKPSK